MDFYVVPETQIVGECLCSCCNKPGLHYDQISDEGVGSDVGVDFLDEIRRDVRVGAGQESGPGNLKEQNVETCLERK